MPCSGLYEHIRSLSEIYNNETKKEWTAYNGEHNLLKYKGKLKEWRCQTYWLITQMSNDTKRDYMAKEIKYFVNIIDSLLSELLGLEADKKRTEMLHEIIEQAVCFQCQLGAQRADCTVFMPDLNSYSQDSTLMENHPIAAYGDPPEDAIRVVLFPGLVKLSDESGKTISPILPYQEHLITRSANTTTGGYAHGGKES